MSGPPAKSFPPLQRQASTTASAPWRTAAPEPARPARPYARREPEPQLAHHFISGADVGRAKSAGRSPPTVVLLHGILGCRRNLQSFARRLLASNPTWQALLVDLRCHGESASLSGVLSGPHDLAAAAGDVLRLLAHLRLFPEAIVGHSFGAKVALAMAQQFACAQRSQGARLVRPVQVWALDALPGPGVAPSAPRVDHPRALIAALRSIELPVPSRGAMVSRLQSEGFSAAVAAWAASALRPARASQSRGPFVWSHDLPGIAQLYASFESADLWPFLNGPRSPGLDIHLVRAERSAFDWTDDVLRALRRGGHTLHYLPGAGHWVHADNPDGLAAILNGPLRAATPAELLPQNGAGPAPQRGAIDGNIIARGGRRHYAPASPRQSNYTARGASV